MAAGLTPPYPRATLVPMDGALRIIPSQPLGFLAPKTASGGKIRAHRVAPERMPRNQLYRPGKTHLCNYDPAGPHILGNTIGNAVAGSIASSQDTSAQGQGGGGPTNLLAGISSDNGGDGPPSVAPQASAGLSDAGAVGEIVVTAPRRGFTDPSGVYRLYLPTPALAKKPSAEFIQRQRSMLDASRIAHDTYDGVDYVYMKQNTSGLYDAVITADSGDGDVVAVPQDYSRLSLAENRNRSFGDANYELNMVDQKNIPVIMTPDRYGDRFEYPGTSGNIYDTTAIYWNPYASLKTDSGYISPATALIHEIGHAFEYSYHNADFRARIQDTHSFAGRYYNAEERFEIRGIEKNAERYFGEPTRDTHGLVMYRTNSPLAIVLYKSPIYYMPW